MAATILEPESVPQSNREFGGGAASQAHISPTILEPSSGWQLINVRELWQHRELLYFFTWRDVKIRYKQTVLGVAWAVIQPFMMMIVFTIFLGRMAKIDSGSFPYPVFVYAGLLPWMFFSTAISTAGNSVVNANNIVTKIYFPRLLIPFASVGAAVVDFFIAFGMLAALMVYYGIQPSWSLLLVPPLLALTIFATLGVGSLLAALNVAYRDFRYTIPFLVQLWMFATPSVYMNISEITDSSATAPQATAPQATAPQATAPQATASQAAASPAENESLVTTGSMIDSETGGESKAQSKSGPIPAGLKPLLYFNPMTGVIAFFRAATLGGPLPWAHLGYATTVIAVLFLAGIFYFRRVESRFADIV